MSNIKVIIPEQDQDYIYKGLVKLTEELHKRGDEISGGFLGGQFGYGAYHDDDVFMMHPYCWCEQDTCQWCVGCNCPDEAWTYLKSGVEISKDQYNDEFYSYAGKMSHELYEYGTKEYKAHSKQWDAKIRERNKIYDSKHKPMCDYCTGKFGNAPNFHYKPTNLRIWWYKYIGRGMEYNRDVTPREFDKIVEHCLEKRS